MKKKMGIQVANKILKKKYILCFLLFSICIQVGYAQKLKNEIYFFIDKSDTLIKKQFNSTTKSYSSYLLIDEERIKELNRTPLVKGKVWIPESDDDFHTLGPSFRFSRENDQIITEDKLSELNIITKRKKFLKKISSLDPSSFSYFFIEPVKHSQGYILREVFPVILE